MARPKFIFLLLSVVAAVWLSKFFKIAQSLKMVAVDHLYAKELKIASLAVKRASVLTKGLSDSIVELSKSGTQIKNDKSPVTVGDYASQALINKAIKLSFPDDNIVGEEDSLSLKDGSEEANALSKRILDLLSETQQKTGKSSEDLGELKDLKEVYESIDFGNYEGGSKGRFWALDPIDGTKGFLRGDQFAVCLALIEDGKVVLGVIGCPNLPEHIVLNDKQSGTKGGLFSAVKGVGSFYTPLFETDEFVPLKDQEKIKMTSETSSATLKVVEGVEKGHSSHSTQSQIKLKLGFSEDTVAQQTINLDSQVKYCVLAKGQADIYLRLPVSDTYREKIWDHAAGYILIYESGGQVGDIGGQALDFGKGRQLDSKGVIAANKAIFPKVIEAVKDVLSQDA
ncbi:3'(2'),5'-bisphosphate nucleotidase 2 [Candidozyma pseudohaemuli]|uniref:3'(2'),5'-bisphosphate nucleotidase n=1 Tax=Candidozyma pseudohaemuli TaxID=418784 RepID=A0A2P7YZP3_9ASCO|nr:3'(2'),5'-bisphosphate nucleotidase 2 [[Candida] pseudohaemulonii]PSK41425.1 3'(2'),5'-bisphosphate nucleotidase 2 [[Candida] pseudohaemulonii]